MRNWIPACAGMTKQDDIVSQDMVSTNNYLLRVEDLRTYYPIRKGLRRKASCGLRRTAGYVRAVDGVSFGIEAGQTLGLVGESGCGKTTVARSIVRLVPAKTGKVVFGRVDVLSAERDKLREVRRQIGLVFQDPYGSLNPRMTVGEIVGEPLKVRGKTRGGVLKEQAVETLSKVGLSGEYMNRYPHEFSGGQRQRIAIARALVSRPKLVILDEPVSGLDVSIQAQILNLLKDLQEELGLTYLFIAHDLAVVEFLCDVVAVMYMGRIVERARAEELYRKPLHPYTQALVSAIPQVGSARRGCRTVPGGEAPGAANQPAGCPFGPRCPLAAGDCLKQMPQLDEKSECRGHFAACWRC